MKISNHIRSLTEQDFDSVYDLYMDDSVNPFMAYDPMDKTAFMPIFKGFMQRDYSWLIGEPGDVHAMCFAIKAPGRCSHVATLLTLAVKKKYQGQGLGKLLVTEALRVLKADGFKRIDLMAEADNDKGLSFYKKMGFQIDGRLPMFLQRRGSPEYVDEILMSITFKPEVAA